MCWTSTCDAVVVKPHPGAIIPLAITVAIARDVLKEAGFDPNIVTLAADSAEQPITKELVCHPDVGIVDFTGSSSFGDWIEANARQAVVFTEKAGVNPVIIDSADIVHCCYCSARQPKDYKSGDLCVACGKQAEPVLTCFWCSAVCAAS